ncbi:MAG: tetratricopeptide repeat protein [Bacteroidia bacterium]|nr:tetratricopeptide repeat protein [Bacteroidia bacterium]
MAQGFYKWFVICVIWFGYSASFAQTPDQTNSDQNAASNKKESKSSKKNAAKKDSLPEFETSYNEALKLIDSSRYKEAVPLLKKTVKLKPDHWEAFNKLAFSNIKLKEYKEAAKNLDKAEMIAPMNFETEKLKGINFFLDKKFKESKAALDTALYVLLEEKLDDPELFYYRAQLMYAGKDLKKALETADIALDVKPKYIEVLMLKAEIRFAQKEYNYVIKDLTEAISYMNDLSTDYNAYKLRARSKFEIGDYKGAAKDWNVYIDANPGEESALVSRAAAKINYNDNSGAIADLDEAVKLNPKNPVIYCYRGTAKGGNKQYVEALKDLDYAIKLKFDYAAAYVNRAAIKMACKDKRGACEDLAKADSLGDEMAVRLYESYCRDKR